MDHRLYHRAHGMMDERRTLQLQRRAAEREAQDGERDDQRPHVFILGVPDKPNDTLVHLLNCIGKLRNPEERWSEAERTVPILLNTRTQLYLMELMERPRDHLSHGPENGPCSS